jgi:hypothetical protein
MTFEEWRQKEGWDSGANLFCAESAWNAAREFAVQECAEICSAIARTYGTRAEGEGEPIFGHLISRESAAKSCAEAINRKLLVSAMTPNDQVHRPAGSGAAQS